jgi:purine-binding chemotaxis protein CheW
MSEDEQALQVVVFTLAGELYGLAIEKVDKIIRYVTPRGLPSSQAWIRGVINLRGRIIPIYDLASRLGVVSEVGEQTKIVIVEAASQTVGLIVDAVEEVLTVEHGRLEKVPIADSNLIESVVKLNDTLVVLLSPNTVFGEIVANAA